LSRKVLREYYELILVFVIFALFARSFVATNVKIPSRSMEDTLLIGDHLVANMFVFSRHLDTPLHRLLPYREVQRGDIVIFRHPQDPRRDLIKRCVALEGDVVEIRAKQLILNGEPYQLEQAVFKDETVYPDSAGVPPSQRVRDNLPPVVVPEGTIFCLGDNRDMSADSRYLGPVPLHYVRGRALLIYWSFETEAEESEWQGPGAKLRQLADVAIHFFSKTRWERQLRLVR
jgi:signal peptidase I